MAISLLGTNDARIDYGDIAAIAGVSALTVAATIKLSAVPTESPIMTQWSDIGFANAAFFFGGRPSGAVKFLLSDGSASYYGKQTSSLTMVNGGLYRIIAKLNPAGNVGAIWVNGVSETVVEFVASSSITIANSASPVLVGRETSSPHDGLDGEYAEVAIWTEYVPDSFCGDYGLGYSPLFYTSNLVFYTKLTSVSDTSDIIGNIAGINTAGTNADHPAVIYPDTRFNVDVDVQYSGKF
jgi:hypothetical protein